MKTLKALAQDAMATIESGFYSDRRLETIFGNMGKPSSPAKRLVDAIREKKGSALICEVKFASPSAGEIRNHGTAYNIAKEMESGGAVGLSVLTEPKNFKGSIPNLIAVRNISSLPIIMKDIIISKEQIIAAKHIGASAVLFIEEIFSDELTKDDLTLDDAVKTAKDLGLDTIIETHTREGLEKISKTSCDIIGINNRDLRTFETKIETTSQLLKGFSLPKTQTGSHDLPLIMSESGYETPEDINNLKMKLRADGSLQPGAYLVGTSIMKSDSIEGKVHGFVEVLNQP